MKKILTKIIVSSVLSVLLTISCCMPIAAQQRGWDVTIEQPDGDKMIITERYDPKREIFYYTDDYGYIIVQNPETRYYVYARVKNKQLLPGDLIFTKETMNNYEDMNRIDQASYFDALENEKAEYPMDYKNKEINLFFGDIYGKGKLINLENAHPFVKENCTMIPFRAFLDGYVKADNIVKSFSCNYTSDILWDGNTQEVTVSKGNKNNDLIRFKVNDKKAYIGKEECNLAVAPVNLNGTVYVPLRFVEEAIQMLNMEKKVKNDKVEIYFT